MFFFCTKWKAFVTRRLPECWRFPRPLRRTPCSKRKRICACCSNRRAVPGREVRGEHYLRRPRTNFVGRLRGTVGRLGATCRYMPRLCRGVARLAAIEYGRSGVARLSGFAGALVEGGSFP